MKDVKNKIKDFYSHRSQLQSEKIVSIEKQFSHQSNEYYSSQNMVARSPFEQ